jgi:hypothetical protein
LGCRIRENYEREDVMRGFVHIVLLLTLAVGTAPFAQTARPVTMTDDPLAGRRAMSVEMRVADRSQEKVIREELNAMLKNLGIQVLAPGQLPIFRLEIDSESISSSTNAASNIDYMFHNISMEFAVRVTDASDSRKTFEAPIWRNRRTVLFPAGSSQQLWVNVRTELRKFDEAYRKANAALPLPKPVRFLEDACTNWAEKDGPMPGNAIASEGYCACFLRSLSSSLSVADRAALLRDWKTYYDRLMADTFAPWQQVSETCKERSR